MSFFETLGIGLLTLLIGVFVIVLLPEDFEREAGQDCTVTAESYSDHENQDESGDVVAVNSAKDAEDVLGFFLGLAKLLGTSILIFVITFVVLAVGITVFTFFIG